MPSYQEAVGDAFNRAMPIFDPNTWVVEPHTHRIYGDDLAQTWAVLDETDYLWFVQWRWNIKWSRGRRKCYLYRPTNVSRINGIRRQKSLYLHVEIMKRTGIEKPTPEHTIVDHRDGNSMNCLRSNLRWATPAMNAKNKNGAFPHDLIEG